MISRIPMCLKLEDGLFWHFDKKVVYFVKIEYKLFLNIEILVDSSSENQMVRMWSEIWKLNIPNKIKTLFGKL